MIHEEVPPSAIDIEQAKQRVAKQQATHKQRLKRRRSHYKKAHKTDAQDDDDEEQEEEEEDSSFSPSKYPSDLDDADSSSPAKKKTTASALVPQTQEDQDETSEPLVVDFTMPRADVVKQLFGGSVPSSSDSSRATGEMLQEISVPVTFADTSGMQIIARAEDTQVRSSLRHLATSIYVAICWLTCRSLQAKRLPTWLLQLWSRYVVILLDRTLPILMRMLKCPLQAAQAGLVQPTKDVTVTTTSESDNRSHYVVTSSDPVGEQRPITLTGTMSTHNTMSETLEVPAQIFVTPPKDPSPQKKPTPQQEPSPENPQPEGKHITPKTKSLMERYKDMEVTLPNLDELSSSTSSSDPSQAAKETPAAKSLTESIMSDMDVS